MSIRRRWALLGLSVCLLVAGACANDNNRGDSSIAPTPAAVVTSTVGNAGEGAGGGRPAAAGGSILNCGEEEQGHGTGYDRAMRECLWQAYSLGGGAVFTTTRPTIEGDPIVWHVRVVSSDEIDVTVDNTADEFAAAEDRGVTTIRCSSMAITNDGQNDFAFELTGCGDPETTSIVI